MHIGIQRPLYVHDDDHCTYTKTGEIKSLAKIL